MAEAASVILRAALYQAMCAEDIYDIRAAIRAMCTKDEIAAVTQEFEENRKRKTAKNKPV